MMQSFVDSFTEGLRKEYCNEGIIVQVCDAHTDVQVMVDHRV